MRRGTGTFSGNPVLIGAATSLVVVVAVFLAYNANSGLPFVPSYQLNAVVPNAANLVVGNEVRVGGSRVGTISAIDPLRRPDGSTVARLKLKLETTVQPLPVDSTVLIRPRSALGLKYVEITKGASPRGLPTGATVPVRNARPEPVEIDEVFAMFDEPTRAASRTNLTEFGAALGARGASINALLGILPSFLPDLERTMGTLGDERTDLDGFFRGLGQAAAETAPVAEAQASLFRGLDTTFTALADVRTGIQDSIETGPEALQTSIDAFPDQRAFLANSTALLRDLRPGVESLRAAAPALADTFELGRPVLRRSVELNERLTPAFRALQRFAEDPMSSLGINGLRTTVEILDPTLRHVTPAQTVCNYATLFLRNSASLLSEGDANGTWQRFIVVSAPSGTDNEGEPASRPANGGGSTGGGSAPRSPRQVNSPPAGGDSEGNFLHANLYPNAAAPSDPRECEAGNEPYLVGRKVVGNVPGTQPATTERTRIRRDSDGSLSQPGENEGDAAQGPQAGGEG